MRLEQVDVRGRCVGQQGRSIRVVDGDREVLLPRCQCDWDEETLRLTVTRWVAETYQLIILS